MGQGTLRARALFVMVLASLTGACAFSPIWQAGPTCEKQPVHAELHLVPGDRTHEVYATDMDSGRQNVVRPRSDVHWRVVATSPPQLTDAEGRVIADDHAIFWEACIDPVSGTYYVAPDDLPGPGGPT